MKIGKGKKERRSKKRKKKACRLLDTGCDSNREVRKAEEKVPMCTGLGAKKYRGNRLTVSKGSRVLQAVSTRRGGGSQATGSGVRKFQDTDR